jgi:hypothetical protein
MTTDPTPDYGAVMCPGCGQAVVGGLGIVIHGNDCEREIMRAEGYVRCGGTTSVVLLRHAGVSVVKSQSGYAWVPPWANIIGGLYNSTRQGRGVHELLDRRWYLRKLARDEGAAKALMTALSLLFRTGRADIWLSRAKLVTLIEDLLGTPEPKPKKKGKKPYAP